MFTRPPFHFSLPAGHGTKAIAIPQGEVPAGIVFVTVNVATSTTLTSFPGPFAV